MIKVCFVRGKYLNNFEGQNYIFNEKKINFTAVSSLIALNNTFPFPIIKLSSPTDLPFLSTIIKYTANRIIGDLHYLYGLERLAGRFDVFHTADPHYYYSYQLARLRKKNKIKRLIATSWETIPFNNETVAKKKSIKYFTLKNIDHFICHTEKAKKTLISEGVSSSKISVIRLGVDLNRFKIQKSKFKNQNDKAKIKKITVLFAGRLVEEKGIVDLYKAFKRIKNTELRIKNMTLNLRIIGDGVLKSYLLNMISSDKLEKDVIIENKNYNEIHEVYKYADIFVLPSKTTKTWEEQYGMVLIEAMASDLPIVAYDSGAISEVIGNAGIIVKEGDVPKLATAINRLIEVKDLRLKLGKIGRERAEKYFDAKKSVKMIENTYFNIATKL